MSIRVKLILTYTLLVVVSACVLIFSGLAIVTKLIVETADSVIEEKDVGVLITEVVDLLAELKQADQYEPEKLISPTYIESLSDRIQFYNGGLIVRHGEKIYNLNDLPKADAFYEQLSVRHDVITQGNEEDYHEEQLIHYKNRTYFYIDYVFQVQKEEVIYYFIIDLTHAKGVGSHSGNTFMTILLIILVIIMTPLLIILTKDIINPLKKLEIGVKHIKEGNLDFKLESNSKNEIGRVITYFDLMRGELKKSIDKQVKFEENRKELISSISHDLKTPITSIKGHVEGIMDGVADTPEKLRKYLGIIYRKSDDMDRLIDDLFLFSKLDLNRLPFDMKKVEMRAFLSDIVNEMKLDWENENQHINLSYAEGDLTILADPQQIKRVLVNVIQNSMKYMDKEHKQIDIRVNDYPEDVQIVIADNGVGIDESHINHVFDRFYRVDESRNLETGGTGLGLAIAKQIVEQHQGHIFATSVPGQGTKIVIDLKKAPVMSTKEEA
jgi:signal transduction histidine kinase